MENPYEFKDYLESQTACRVAAFNISEKKYKKALSYIPKCEEDSESLAYTYIKYVLVYKGLNKIDSFKYFFIKTARERRSSWHVAKRIMAMLPTRFRDSRGFSKLRMIKYDPDGNINIIRSHFQLYCLSDYLKNAHYNDNAVFKIYANELEIEENERRKISNLNLLQELGLEPNNIEISFSYSDNPSRDEIGEYFKRNTI